MRTEQRTIYIAKDNSEHLTEVDALAHEAKIDLQEWGDTHLYRDMSVSDIVDTLVEEIETLAPLVETIHKAVIAQKRYANSGRS